MNHHESAEPAPPARNPERNDEVLLNRAYRCFAFLGIVTFLLALLDILSGLKAAKGMEENWGLLAELVGMLLALPICVGMLYATIYGIRQAVRFRHRPLVFLSAVSIICDGAFLLSIPYWDSPGGAAAKYLATLGFWLYIAANILIPGWWLMKGRRQYRSKVGLQRVREHEMAVEKSH